MTLLLARVAAVHHEDHSVDLVMVDGGARYTGAQVLTSTASSNSGVFDMPTPTTGDKWSLAENRANEVLAVCAMLGGAGVPVVLGFLFPQVNGMLFEAGRRVMRHGSDVYTSIDGAGNIELAHPNGTYLRIGTSPDHEDLSGADYDGNWSITKNTGAATHLQVVVKAGGAQKAKIHVDPDGNLTIEHTGNLVVNTDGTANINVDGATTLNTPTTTITGDVTIQGSLAVTGASLTHKGKNVGDTHRHSGVAAGGANTGIPT